MKAKITRVLTLFLTLIPLATFAQVNLPSGLIAHVPLNGNGNDISGNGNHATLSAFGVTPTFNYLNMPTQAMFFNGGSDNGTMSFNTPLLNNRASFSMSYWFNLSSLTNGMSMVGQDNILETGFYTGPNRIVVFHPTGSANVNLALGANNWQHIVVTCDNTSMKVYLNGVLSANLAGNYALGNNAINTNIGGNVVNQSNNSWFRGALDEVRFYDRVLSAAEVALLNNTSPLSITINSINGTSFCAGDPLQINFTASGDIYTGNVYYLEMSNATGSFTNPIQVASLSSTSLVTSINTVVPTGTPSGTGYKFRVVSNNLNAVGGVSSSVTINGLLGDIPNPASFRYIGNVGGKDYFISLASLNYTNARNTCVTNGGVLATVPTRQVNELFYAHAIGTKDWVGFTDEITEGNFMWTGNEPITYTNWGNGQPDNSSNEDYTELLANTGKWNDRVGTDLNNYFMQLAPAGNNQFACVGSTLNLTAVTVPGATYSWTGPNSFTSSSQNPTISGITAAAAGIYTVTITNGSCSATATTSVTVNPPPNNLGQSSVLLPSLSGGLVLYYPMNGNATDASGGGNNGTLFGGVTATADRFGNVGQALQFNGTNGYIDVPDGVYFTGSDFTVSSWVKVAAYNYWSRLFDFGNGPANNNILMALTNLTTGRPATEIYNNTTSGGQFTSATTIPTNAWKLLTYTYANGIGTMYLNGVQIAQASQLAPLNVTRTINYIGRSNWAGDAYANAAFDDFRIYNRLLSNAEIQSLLNEQAGALANLISPSAICINTSSQIILHNTQVGMSYQLRNATAATNIGSAQMGTGDSLIFNTGSMATTTDFNFVVTNTVTGCLLTTGPNLTLTVYPAPLAPTTIGQSLCNGGIFTLHASGTSVANYNWYTQAAGGTPLPGITADSLTTAFIDETVSYWVSITDLNGCESARSIVTATVINPLNPPVDIVTGLILYYKFNGNLADSSGFGYNATITGTNSYVNDRNGNVNAAINSTASGDPGNNWMSSGNPLQIQQLTNQVTFSVWIRQTQTWFGSSGTDGHMPLINKWDGSNGLYMGLHMYPSGSGFSNRVRWRFNGAVFLESSVNVPINVWHHIVCTYNGTQLRIYQNGVLSGTLNYTGGIPNTGVNLFLGRQANGTPSGGITYRGDWDQVRIYNRALNASEALTLYNNESVAFGNTPLCDGQGNITLSTFNFPGATYNWTGPNGFTSTLQNPPVIVGATTANSGTYHLLVTNYGCTSPDQPVTIVVNPLPSVSISINDTVCGSGNADLVVGGAPAGSTYQWYTVPVGGTPIAGQTDSTYTVAGVVATTTYYVSATSLGCVGSRTPVTAVYNSPVVTGLTVTGSSVCSGITTTNITINSSETGVNYQAFFGGNPISASVGGGGTLVLNINTTGMLVGNNTVTVTATKPGCGPVNLTNTAIINVLPAPAANITPSGPTTFCAGGSVDLTSSSGASYVWSTLETTPTIQVTTSGTYQVTVTGANGCTNTSANLLVTVNPIPNASITAGGPTSFCSGGNVTLTGNGGGTYVWNTGATTPSITVNSSGTYQVTVTAAGCSSVSANVNVNVLALPTVGATAAPGTVICQGESIVLNGTGALSYTWSGGITNGVLFAPPVTNTYTVTGTDANGCTNTSTINITVNNLPVVGTNAIPSTSICMGDGVTLSGTGAASYTWSGGITNGSAFVPAMSSTYTVTGTDGNGCSNTNSVAITVNQLPLVGSTISPASTVCYGTNVTLTGTGANTYSWSGGIINATPFPAVLSATYTVTGTDLNGCFSTNTVTLNILPLPNVNAGVNQSVCFGDTVILSGAGALSYSWNNGVINNNPFVPLVSANYIVTGTDLNSCTNTDTVMVLVNSLPLVNGGADQTSCNGNAITLTGSGAVSYIWTGGVINNTPFVPSASANYTVTGTDLNGCSNTDEVWVTLGIDPVFSLGPDVIQVNPPVILDAGAGWTAVDWSTGATTQTINVNANSTLICTVTNADGCTATDTISVWFTSGIAEDSVNHLRLSLYPNPNNGVFNLEINHLVTDDLMIEIVDMQGKIVYQQPSIQVNEIYHQLLNLQQLREGMYTVKLNFNGIQQQLRFIKHQ
jgi:hypothetical protein